MSPTMYKLETEIIIQAKKFSNSENICTVRNTSEQLCEFKFITENKHVSINNSHVCNRGKDFFLFKFSKSVNEKL